MSYYTKHKELLDRCQLALFERTYYAPYPELPSPKIYGETAEEDGKKTFEAILGNKFEGLYNRGNVGWIGEEESPFTVSPLGVLYPVFEPETLIENAENAWDAWASLSIQERAGLLVEVLEDVKQDFFSIAFATMHTTGQGFMMAFQASGPHAADRALEAVAMGLVEQTRFPEETVWDKPMGKFNIKLKKHWVAIPKGVGLVVGCSTFPTWNSLPGIFANLVCGNPVIVKPHPKAILPIALVVKKIQQVLKTAGIPETICQLAVDTLAKPITSHLAENASIKLIDYTGSSAYGDYLEGLKDKIVFTEKAGVNPVVLHSLSDPDAVFANLAFSVSLYSGQMCTAPQNIFVNAEGVKIGEETLSPLQVAEKLSQAIENLINNPKAGPFVAGAIQNPATLYRLEKIGSQQGLTPVLSSKKLENPQFGSARTATPAVALAEGPETVAVCSEQFGPIVFVVPVKGGNKELLNNIANLISEKGAISCGVYTTEETFKKLALTKLLRVGAPVSFNLTGQIFVNQHAAFSDFHVTGGNPAGNASLTNPEFLTKRFSIVGWREPAE